MFLNILDDTSDNYTIVQIADENYLIMDWKSGDYQFDGQIRGCYVLKKQ